MMIKWILIGIILLVLLAARSWVKRHPSKRKQARVKRKNTRHLRSRHIHRRGGVENVKMCSCGDVGARCGHITRRAETARGMGQKR